MGELDGRSSLHRKFKVMFPPDGALHVGDVLLSINGVSAASLLSPDDLIEVVRKVPGDEIMITILPISPLRYQD